MESGLIRDCSVAPPGGAEDTDRHTYGTVPTSELMGAEPPSVAEGRCERSQ